MPVGMLIPIIETLLKQLEKLRAQYALQDQRFTAPLPVIPARRGKSNQSIPPVLPSPIPTETFLAVRLNNAWKKLNKYYTLTDKSPVYVLTFVLNPQHKWKYFEKTWVSHLGLAIYCKTKGTSALEQIIKQPG